MVKLATCTEKAKIPGKHFEPIRFLHDLHESPAQPLVFMSVEFRVAKMKDAQAIASASGILLRLSHLYQLHQF